MDEIKIYKSISKALKLILISTIFVLLSLWLWNIPSTPAWVTWMGIIVFGPGILIGILLLFDRRPELVINEIGIFTRSTGKQVINWELIQSAYLHEISGQYFICLVIDEKFQPSRNKGKWYQRTVSLNKKMGFQELNILLGQLNINRQRLLEFILAMSNIDTANPKARTKMLLNFYKKVPK